MQQFCPTKEAAVEFVAAVLRSLGRTYALTTTIVPAKYEGYYANIAIIELWEDTPTRTSSRPQRTISDGAPDYTYPPRKNADAGLD